MLAGSRPAGLIVRTIRPTCHALQVDSGWLYVLRNPNIEAELYYWIAEILSKMIWSRSSQFDFPEGGNSYLCCLAEV